MCTYIFDYSNFYCKSIPTLLMKTSSSRTVFKRSWCLCHTGTSRLLHTWRLRNSMFSYSSASLFREGNKQKHPH